jgi:hypothetical protein
MAPTLRWIAPRDPPESHLEHRVLPLLPRLTRNLPRVIPDARAPAGTDTLGAMRTYLTLTNVGRWLRLWIAPKVHATVPGATQPVER